MKRRAGGSLIAAAWTGLAWSGMRAVAAPSLSDVLDALVASYPDMLVRHDDRHVYWRDGTALAVSDGREHKRYQDLLVNASILDQFLLPYPRGRLEAPPAVNADPGRFRNEAFFRKIYGDCEKGEVQRNLVPIAWMPNTWNGTVWVTKVNGIAEKLQRVSDDIDRLPEAIKAAAWPIAGVFSCRVVHDTGRASMHAYAAAIDLNVKTSDYWLWQATRKGTTIPYRSRMPQEIVDIFERYGFIWGGKWYHYDTMHFEYRPELLKVDETAPKKAAASRP